MLYTNCDIPAKLFYKEIIDKSNLDALGEGTPEEKEAAFYSILDELCDIEKNYELSSIYDKKEQIKRIQAIVSVIETILFAMVFLPSTQDELNEQIDIINSIEYIKVKFSKDKPLSKEIERVHNSVIGALMAQISELEDSSKVTGSNIKSSFEKDVLTMARISGVRLNDEDSLRYFTELKIISRDIVKQQSKKKHG